jgi:hypothetical protein
VNVSRFVAIVVGVAIAVVLALLIFGGDDPELSPQDQGTPTPTATATATPAASIAPGSNEVAVRVAGPEALTVAPAAVGRDGRTVFLAYANEGSRTVEVFVRRGVVVTGARLRAGESRRDGVQLDAGRYTVEVRPRGAAAAGATATLEVR